MLAIGAVHLATKLFHPDPWRPLDISPIRGITLTLTDTQQTMEDIVVRECPAKEPHYHLEFEGTI